MNLSLQNFADAGKALYRVARKYASKVSNKATCSILLHVPIKIPFQIFIEATHTVYGIHYFHLLAGRRKPNEKRVAKMRG